MAKEYLTIDGKLMSVDGKLVQVPDPENINDLADSNLSYATLMSDTVDNVEDLLINGVIDGSPKGVYANLSALQTALPDGASGVYLTRDNGHWYFWNDTEWVDGGLYRTDPDYDTLKSNVDTLSSVAIASEFVRGGWNAVENKFVELSTRILSANETIATDDFTISIKSGYEFNVYTFSESGSSHSGFSTIQATIKKGQKYRIGVRKIPEETSIEVDIEEYASKLIFFRQSLTKDEEYLYKNSYDIPTNDWLRKNGDSLVVGSIWGDGSFHSEQSFRVSTENLVTAICDFSINAKPGFFFIAYIYNGSVYNSSGKIKKLNISKGEQFKLVILRAVENTSEIADIDTFAKGISINSVEFIAENSSSRLFGKKINVIGDSYVANHQQSVSLTWHSKMASKNKMVYRNYGINGNGLVANATGTPVVSRYSEMEDDADYIVVIGGKNDYNSQISLDDFKNGLSILCKGLVHKYIGKQICFFTPWRVPQDIIIECDSNQANATIPLIDYCDAIIEVCKKYSIPCFDTKDSGIYTFDSTFRTNYFQGANDISHLNGNGHDLMLRKAEPFLESL